jgi:hypothetical protein
LSDPYQTGGRHAEARNHLFVIFLVLGLLAGKGIKNAID